MTNGRGQQSKCHYQVLGKFSSELVFKQSPCIMRTASYILYMLWNCSGRTEYNPNLLKYTCSIECRYTFILLQLFNFLDLFWREHRKYLSRSLSSKNKIMPVTQFCWIPVALIILKVMHSCFFSRTGELQSIPSHTFSSYECI